MPAPLLIRRATETEIPLILALVAGGASPGKPHAESAKPEQYLGAFRKIDADPRQLLMVAEQDGEVVGTFQLTEIQHLAFGGGRSAVIEAVHVRADLRSRGLGAAMMRWAIDEARRRGCMRVQLTSNKDRQDAHRFYQRLGFSRSHEGFKLLL